MTRAAASHRARFLWGNLLYLKGGTKDHFLDFARQEYPDLTERFARLYPRAYAPERAQAQLRERLADLKRAHGVAGEMGAGRTSERPRQLTLALR